MGQKLIANSHPDTDDIDDSDDITDTKTNFVSAAFAEFAADCAYSANDSLKIAVKTDLADSESALSESA